MIRRPGKQAGAGGARRQVRGRAEGPEDVGSVLRRVLGDLRLDERTRHGPLAAAWEAAAGAELAARARPVAFRGGVLTVEVEGASLLQEVRGFRAADILRALKAEPGGKPVRDIRYVPAGRTGGAS